MQVMCGVDRRGPIRYRAIDDVVGDVSCPTLSLRRQEPTAVGLLVWERYDEISPVSNIVRRRMALELCRLLIHLLEWVDARNSTEMNERY